MSKRVNNKIDGVLAFRSREAHDPVPIPIVNADNELADNITKATTLEELEAALLGKVGVVRVKGRKK